MDDDEQRQLAEAEINTQRDDKKLAVKTWRDDKWFQSGWQVDKNNALFYFCNSGNPFYDVKSNNEVLKMQQRDWSSLREMHGICYELTFHKDPYLYVISKEIVYSKENVSPISVYYIIGGTVYMSPSFYKALSARMYNCLNLLNETFNAIQSHARYSATLGTYHWDFDGVERELQDEIDKSKEEKEQFEYNRTFRYVADSAPPYSNEMQHHVDQLITEIDLDTKKLIDAKKAKQEQAATTKTETPIK
ncbi:mediator of RNA polymerase II transcription subunit med6 [Acrasis kona]|uniref:Mediator of RNA polymerase II transcription subunit 6 n=1 Tax=Acrasis kona TaxID=1008807 RepID=A0AAW2YIM9_9EUKA